MSASQPQQLPDFVDRKEEMRRIEGSIDKALKSEGQLLIVHGEPGVGKTRLVQEASERTRSRGFIVGCGSGLSESIVPYQPWAEVLRGIGLEHVLEELPPPKLLALFLLAPDGNVITKVKLKDVDAGALRTAEAVLKKTREGPKALKEPVVKEGSLTVHVLESQRLLVLQDRKLAIGALILGREDEAFLDDLRELAENIESRCVKGSSAKKPKSKSAVSAKAILQELLDSGKYEGIDHSRNNPELRRERLFNNAALGIARKAKNNPVLIVVDDLQWADPSSLSIMQYVARNTRKSAVLILGAHRTEMGEVRSHLRTALKKISQEGLSAELDLTGLAREHLRDLANSFLGPHELPEDFLDHLWTETEGNPLFVREVLRRLEEEGAIKLKVRAKCLVRPVKGLELPKRVRDVIRARLDILPKEDRELLDAAAVCGSRFTASLVAKVAGEDESKALNGLNNIAKVHGLLQPAGLEFTFNHPTIQEVAHEALSKEARQTYHREAAQWLELAGGPIEDIAEHYYMARDERAPSWLQRAAETAEKRYANEEAIRFCSEALEFEKDSKNRSRIFEKLGDIHDLTGHYDKAIESYDDAFEMTEDIGKKAEVKAKAGRIQEKKGDYDKAIEVCTEALGSVKGEGCKEEALTLCNIGIVHYRRGDYDKAMEYHERSLEIREKTGDQRSVASSLNNIGNVYLDRGNYDKALEYYERCISVAEKIGDQDRVAMTLNNIGVVHRGRGDYDKARECYERSIEMLEKTGNQNALANSLNNLGNVYYDFWYYDKALEYYEKSLQLKEKIGAQVDIADSIINIGNVHFGRGDYEKAMDCFEKSLVATEKSGNKYSVADSLCSLAETHLKKLDYAKAMDFCTRAREVASYKGILARICRVFGKIHMEQRNWRKSIASFQECIKMWEEMGGKGTLGEAHYDFGMMWKSKGDIGKAKKHLRVAIELFDKIKATKWARKARKAYRACSKLTKQ